MFKSMNVMIFPQTFKCPGKLWLKADKQCQNFFLAYHPHAVKLTINENKKLAAGYWLDL